MSVYFHPSSVNKAMLGGSPQKVIAAPIETSSAAGVLGDASTSKPAAAKSITQLLQQAIFQRQENVCPELIFFPMLNFKILC